MDYSPAFIGFNASPAISLSIGILFGVLAYIFGRNVFIWFLFGYVLPVLALVFFIIRVKNVPRLSPAWVSDLFLRYKSWQFTRNIKPDDFDDRR